MGKKKSRSTEPHRREEDDGFVPWTTVSTKDGIGFQQESSTTKLQRRRPGIKENAPQCPRPQGEVHTKL